MSGDLFAPCARPFAFAKGRRLTIRLLGFDRARLIGLDDQLGVGTRFELAVKALYPGEDGYKRLQAMPWASRCIQCPEQSEQGRPEGGVSVLAAGSAAPAARTLTPPSGLPCCGFGRCELTEFRHGRT